MEITPEYINFFELAGDEYIKYSNMISFASDAVYSKTHFACLDYELYYDETLQIKLIKEFQEWRLVLHNLKQKQEWIDGYRGYLYHYDLIKLISFEI